MSFDVNIGRHQPAIKAASNMNNDGGSGGNTGYMMSGQNKKKKKDQNIFDFNDQEKKDTFEHYQELNKQPEDISPTGFIKNFIKKFM